MIMAAIRGSDSGAQIVYDAPLPEVEVITIKATAKPVIDDF